MSSLDVLAGITMCGGALTALAVRYRTELRIAAAGWRRRHPNPVDVAAVAVLGPVPVDHAPCKVDDCDREVCYCEAPSTCPGASEALCGHGDMVCEDHRLECTDCLIDYITDTDYDPEVA